MSGILCGQEWARSVPKGDVKVAIICVNNIQEWSGHTEKFKTGQADNFRPT